MKIDLIAYLNGHAAIVAVAGDKAVRPARRGQKVHTKSITLQATALARDYAMRGASGLDAGGFRLDCWGATYEEADLIAQAVKAACDAIAGTRGGSAFQGAFVESERDFFEGEAPEPIFRTSLDVTVWRRPA